MPPPSLRPPVSVIGGLGLAILLDTVIQLAWKHAAGPSSEGPSPLVAVLVNPWFAGAMAAFGLQLWNWLRVLSRADLSFVQPITALSYVSVLGLSSLLLHERISARQGLGLGLILLGVWFISRTPLNTSPSATPNPTRQP